jgi:hypothetical protein
VTLLLWVVLALDLLKARMHRRVVEVAEKVRVAELDADNAKLLVELNQLAWRWSRLMLPKVHCLRVGTKWNKNAQGCTLLHSRGENAQLVTDHEAEVAVVNKKF